MSSSEHDAAAEGRARRLCWHGLLLFLLGLVTGLVMQQFTNPRMGLAAHLEGVMNGIFLLALGGVWRRARFSPRSATLAFRSVLYGTYANWTFTTLGATFGTVALTPLASEGHRGQPWQEMLMTAGLVSVAIAMILASVLLLLGFRGGAKAEE